MHTLSLVFATWFQPEWSRCVESWNHESSIIPRMSIIPAYQMAYEITRSDIIGYVHDDLLCGETTWKERVLCEFEDLDVGIVGFAGATGYCHPTMSQFDPHAMGRIGFQSNLSNAEAHGARFSGSCNVAMIDGLAIFVRRQVLDSLSGWPVNTPCGYFMYTEWLCCSVMRLGMKIRMVGVACNHLGGRTTGYNPNLNPDWEGEHRYIYDEFRKDGVIPARVEP